MSPTIARLTASIIRQSVEGESIVAGVRRYFTLFLDPNPMTIGKSTGFRSVPEAFEGPDQNLEGDGW